MAASPSGVQRDRPQSAARPPATNVRIDLSSLGPSSRPGTAPAKRSHRTVHMQHRVVQQHQATSSFASTATLNTRTVPTASVPANPFSASGRSLQGVQVFMAELGLNELGLHGEGGWSVDSISQLPQQPLRATRSNARFFQNAMLQRSSSDVHSRSFPGRVQPKPRNTHRIPATRRQSGSSSADPVRPSPSLTTGKLGPMHLVLPSRGVEAAIRVDMTKRHQSVLGDAVPESVSEFLRTKHQIEEAQRLGIKAADPEWVRRKVVSGSKLSSRWDYSQNMTAMAGPSASLYAMSAVPSRNGLRSRNPAERSRSAHGSASTGSLLRTPFHSSVTVV